MTDNRPEETPAAAAPEAGPWQAGEASAQAAGNRLDAGGFDRAEAGKISDMDHGTHGEQGPGRPTSGDRVVGEQGPDHPVTGATEPPAWPGPTQEQPTASASSARDDHEDRPAPPAPGGDQWSAYQERPASFASHGDQGAHEDHSTSSGPHGDQRTAAQGGYEDRAAPFGAHGDQWAAGPQPVHQDHTPSGAHGDPYQGQAGGHTLRQEQPGYGGQQPGWAPGGQHTGEQVLFGSAVGGHPGQGGHPGYPVGPQAVPAQRKRGGSGLLVGVTALALVFGGAAGAAGGYLVAENGVGASTSSALDAPKPARQAATPAPAGSVEAVAEKVLPSVVQLQVRGRSAAGEGSGFVISEDGLMVTNNHVIEAAADGGQITAVFQDGRTAAATIVGRDPTSDVAVVKAQDIGGLTVAELGRSDDLRVGQSVVAIGSPFELSGTVTSGIISSLQRPTRAGGESGSQTTVLDAIQTDAAINPGNSGGPLVDTQGRVIGINSAIYSPGAGSGDAGSVGIGFAIPIDQARRTADEIVKTGKATQTVLGVTVRDNPQGGGALIAEVVAGGAGEQAGLRQGEVVTQLDDRRIDSSDALVAAVRSKSPGDKVKLVIGDGERTVEATLGGQPVEAG